mmetsp:Transcript_25797/g.46551  ORF Transcript_25797/g.46551 Transcript_25797/m.46551 type:complete len:657 (+) Transcript_25797:131-2101(+)
MASSIASILGRKVLPAAIFGGGISPLFDDKSMFGSPSTASCEAPPTGTPSGTGKDRMKNPFLAPQLRETVLRKRMTSVGRFSLKSETEENRSIPTFFLALSGEKKKVDGTPDAAMHKFSPRKIFTVSDFEDAWLKRDMPSRHPRFHSTVCPQQQYFEETHHVHPSSSGMSGEEDESSLQIKAKLDRHASETMHFSVYRDDLRNRLEHMLMSPLEVSEKLWEVKISNGLLGSSGAISRAKVDAILTADRNSSLVTPPTNNNRATLSRNTTKGGLWRDATQEVESIPMESVLLFRSHHALADGASIMAALSDLCDEAEEIRENIEMQLKKWKGKGKKGPKKSVFRRILSRLARLLKMCLWFSFGTASAFIYQGYLQITTPRNPFDAVREDAEKKGLALSGRSISWCDAAPLDEVKRIANIIGKARGVAITVNDLFVSCAVAAVTRQLIEHEEFMAPIDAHKRKFVPRNINVVVPVHLRGGVILPNESLGNNIGAFVTRCPGEMKHDAVGGGTTPCPTERLYQVHKSLLYSKRSPAPFVSHYIAKFCSDYLPEEWTKSIFQRANANACVVVSNNRGYDKKMHIHGMAVESAAGFLPLPPGIPIGVVVQSYAGTMSLSVTAEKWAVPDADKFLRWTLDEYHRLHEEASKLETQQKMSKLE